MAVRNPSLTDRTRVRAVRMSSNDRPGGTNVPIVSSSPMRRPWREKPADRTVGLPRNRVNSVSMVSPLRAVEY